MKQHTLFIVALLAASQSAWSATTTTAAATKEAATRYAADKKLCTEETSSSLRMQCLRDAKADYDKALAAAKAAGSTTTAKTPAAHCADCGRVIDVQVVDKQGEGGPLGIIGGGAAGALLGRQVGKGTGKDLATIAGAAAGAYGGHMLEEKMKSSKVWAVRVRLDSGEERSFDFAQDPGFSAGDAVKLSGNSIVRR